MQTSKYLKSPIVEVVCEFRFNPNKEWDFTYPGLLYERLKIDFPRKQAMKQIGISTLPDTKEPTIQQEITERIQFFREDNSALVQIAPSFLSVNHLSPYPTWKKFLPMVLENFKRYKEVTNPQLINRIGLRYINEIEIPIEGSLKMEDFFEFYPHLGKGLPQEHGPFMTGVHFFYESQRDTLRLQIALTNAKKPKTAAFILDLDYFLAEPTKVSMDIDKVTAWLVTAHDRVEQIFEASITDKARKLFN